ncbi:MAG: Mov34/MPN/PAD-1 family protein [Dehalococcoidia bacterium]
MGMEDRPVYRTRPLPQEDLRGRFLLPEAMIEQTRDALIGFALAGLRDGGHEGLVFWAGLENGPFAALTTVVVPAADHSSRGVFITESAYGSAVSEARRAGVVLLAQVHSHPGADARHSDGDDELIIMPFEGMLSIVVPNYGIGWQDLMNAKVHQFQGGRWILCLEESVRRGITIAPRVVDAR